MSISIRNKEAEALVAELTRTTGQGTTDLLLGLLRGAVRQGTASGLPE